MNAMILKCADHLQAGTVSDMRQTGILVTAKVALENAAIVCPVKERAPRLQLTHALGSLAGMKFGHSPVVEILASPHGVGEMDLPAVPLVNVGQSRSDAALGHDRMGFAQKRFADDADGDSGCRRFNGGA